MNKQLLSRAIQVHPYLDAQRPCTVSSTKNGYPVKHFSHAGFILIFKFSV